MEGSLILYLNEFIPGRRASLGVANPNCRAVFNVVGSSELSEDLLGVIERTFLTELDSLCQLISDLRMV